VPLLDPQLRQSATLRTIRDWSRLPALRIP
jgi:hypothetical protein